MIPKEELSGEEVRQIVEQISRTPLDLAIDGYNKCDSSVLNVLVKAVLEGQTIESVCAGPGLAVGSNAVRERLNQLLDACDLRLHECGLHAGVALLWRNLWIMLHWMATHFIALGPARWEPLTFRLHRFIAFLRRAIEHALGSIDSIPVCSW